MITKDMTVVEILNMDEKYEKVFERHLLSCAGCPGAASETLEEAAKGHGVDISRLMEELNQA